MPILELKADPSAMRRIVRAISDALFRRGRTADNKPHPGVEESGDLAAKAETRRTQATRQRLAEAMARLECLDSERERWADSRFGNTMENRIIWGELMELELQEIDEQVSRIRAAAARNPRAPVNLREGGALERDDS